MIGNNTLSAGQVALLARRGCNLALATLRHFHHTGLLIPLVIVETGQRKKFSESERAFKAAHAAFDQWLTQQNGVAKSSRDALWNRVGGLPRRLLRSFTSRNASDSLDVEAKRVGARVIEIKRHSSVETRSLLEREGIGLVLLASSSWLIKEPLLSMPATRIVNAHCAKLPQHRSLDSLPWSVAAGDELGTTTHFVDAGIDTGSILEFIPIEPKPSDNLNTFRDRVDSQIPEIFRRCVIGLRAGTIRPRAQAAADGTHHNPMTFEQLVAAENIFRQRVQAATSPKLH